MRSIGPEWRNLAEGFLRVEALEVRFCAGGISNKEMCRRTGLSYDTLKKYLAHLDAEAVADDGGPMVEPGLSAGDAG